MGCTPNAELQKRGCILTVELQNLGCIRNVKLPRVHPEHQTSETRVHSLKVKSHKLGCTLHLIMKFPYFFHTFLFCFILYMVTESHMRPQQKCTLISKVPIPLIFMTLITLLWLSIALFWQYVFTRSAQQKIKAPVKVNPFSVFLLSDWSGLLCTDQSISGRTSSRLYEY